MRFLQTYTLFLSWLRATETSLTSALFLSFLGYFLHKFDQISCKLPVAMSYLILLQEKFNLSHKMLGIPHLYFSIWFS